MKGQLRIWRVTTSKASMKAPSFFVETTEDDLEKAETKAILLAKQRSSLSRFEEWKFTVEKVSARKDEFGRYVKYHQ